MLTLRPFTSSDFPLLASWFSSLPEVVQWGGSHLSFPLAQADMSDMLAQGQASPPNRRCWMVCRDSTPVGHAQLAYDWRDGNARLGRVAIAPAERGQGLARPMVTLMIKEAFQTPGIERPPSVPMKDWASRWKACGARPRAPETSVGTPA
jgi:RimJ/RimL family protein N-acetyltransferase